MAGSPVAPLGRCSLWLISNWVCARWKGENETEPGVSRSPYGNLRKREYPACNACYNKYKGSTTVRKVKWYACMTSSPPSRTDLAIHVHRTQYAKQESPSAGP